MKYVVGFVLSILLLGVVLFFLINHLPGVQRAPKISPTPTPEKLTEHETLVTYTQDGFSPSVVTIPSGSSVRFTNLSTTTASVNSDNYPTNKLYPELNLGRFEKKESIIVNLKKAGTYTYHNQFNPKQTGKIIVQ
jgi:plastocyanin